MFCVAWNIGGLFKNEKIAALLFFKLLTLCCVATIIKSIKKYRFNIIDY